MTKKEEPVVTPAPIINKRGEDLANRYKIVETLDRIELIKQRRLEATQKSMIADLSIEAEQISNEKERKRGDGLFSSPIMLLLMTMDTNIIDNDKTVVGSEPYMKNVWDEEELTLIKSKIMQKIREI